jgi:hypothetical protein
MVSVKQGKVPPRPGTVGGVGLYPWDEWFSLPRFEVRRADYRFPVAGFPQQVRNAARRRGLYVSIDADRRGNLRVEVSRTPFLRRGVSRAG